jgi:cyclopropane fatty-acyl-phospholipid synthase-like methyltransferase
VVAHQVIDIGCGIGGPLRAISGFSGAAVVGVNNNAYQVRLNACAQQTILSLTRGPLHIPRFLAARH